MCCFVFTALQHMGKGDDALREALYHLRDLMDYAHLFTFVNTMQHIHGILFLNSH